MFSWWCLRTANALARLRLWAGSPEPLQGAYMISTLFACAGTCLKMIIFYRSHAQLIFTRVTVLWQFFNSKSCLCNSASSFQWIIVKPSIIVAMTWRGSYYTEVRFDRFLPELWPFVSLNHLPQKFLSPQHLLHFSRDIDETFQLLFPCPEDFIEVMLNWFLPELRSFDSLVSATPLAVFSGF